MNLFKKRPLGLILGIILCGLYSFSLLSDFALLVLIIAVFTVIILIFSIPRLRSLRKTSFLLLLFLLSGSVARFYFEVFFATDVETDEQVFLTATVYDVTEHENFDTIEARLKELDGKASRKRIIINVSNEYNLTPGDVISVKCELTSLYNGGASDANRYNLSRGISASCYASELSVIDSGPYPLEYLMKLWRTKIAERISENSNGEASGLATALLLGDTSYLDERTSLSFSQIGITHILALSGTHITLLSLALSKLIRMLGLSKRLEKISLIFVIIAFMALVGFPSSVLRAGIMVIISTCLYLICAGYDTITSLFVALSIIVILEPYSVFDLGLLLSFLATFGILVYVEYRKSRKTTESGGAVNKLSFIIMFSVFAVSCTQVICSLYFDKISAISVLTTIIFSVLTEVVLYLGVITALLGSIIPIGSVLSFACNLTRSLSISIAELDGCEFSSGFTLIKLLSVALFAVMVYFAVAKLKRPRRYVGFICAVYVSICLLGVFLNYTNSYEERIIYQSNRNDRIVVCSDGDGTLIDIGSHRAEDYYGALEFIYSEKLCSLDNLVLIGYSNTTNEYLHKFLAKVSVENLYLPTPKEPPDESFAAEIIKTAEYFDTKTHFIDDTQELYFGKVLAISHELPDYTSMLSLCSLTLSVNNTLFSYLTPDSAVNSPIAAILTNASDTVAFGTFGSSNHPYAPEVLTGDGKRVIISNESRIISVLIDPDAEIITDKRVAIYD